MSRSKGARNTQTAIALKLGRLCHLSTRRVKQDFMPYFKEIFQKDKEFQLKMAIDLELDEEEVAFLLEDKIDSNAVKHVMSDMRRVVDAKERKMEKAIERKTAPEEEPEAETKPQPAPSQRTLF